MDITDSYKTAAKMAVCEIKIKGSRFIGQLYLCETADQALDLLKTARKKYHDATHNCYGWKTGIGNDVQFKYSDDGEPNGSAGKPIYDQLEGAGLINILIIVTRYYGGTKLGTGGLTHAYSETAGEVIRMSGVITKYLTETINAEVEFSDFNLVERISRDCGARILESDFTNKVRLQLEIRLSQINILKNKLIDATSGRIKF